MNQRGKSRRGERGARGTQEVHSITPVVAAGPEDELRRRGLPSGYILANFRDDEFEVAPGLYMVLSSSVKDILRRQSDHLNPNKALREMLRAIQHLPANVFYCRGTRDSPEAKALRDADYVLDLPVIDGCIPLVFPTVFQLQQGVNLISGFQFLGQGNEYIFSNLKTFKGKNSTDEIVTLPHDLLLLQMADDLPLPYGIYPVQISNRMVLPPDRDDDDHLFDRKVQLPVGHELVQVLNCAIDFPVGLEVSPGVKIAATPIDIVLPECVRLVKKDPATPLPDFLVPVKRLDADDELNMRPKLRDCCMIVEKPREFFFDLGIEVLYRPPGFPLPPGMRLVPIQDYPEALVLPAHQELVQLEPKFDLPECAKLTPAWYFCPRPFGFHLHPGQFLVHPDPLLEEHAVPPLPHYVCMLPMPPLPHGVILPARTKLIVMIISRFTQFALPDGTILGPGVTVVSPKVGKVGHRTELHRPAVNAVVVRRTPGFALPPSIQRGSRSDLPSGLLLEANMEIVRIPVRFEIPIGVKVDSNVTLGPCVQLAPGTILKSGMIQVGRKAAKPLVVLEWPHGVCLPSRTELVKMPSGGDPLPFEFQSVQPPEDVVLPKGVIMIKLPRKLLLQSSLEIAEQIVFGVESVMDEYRRSLPMGMVFVSRQSVKSQWPAELTPVPHSLLPKKLVALLEQHGSEASSKETAFKTAERKSGVHVRMNMNIEVARLHSQNDFPAGVELLPGVHTMPRPYWAMPMHNVVLIQLPEEDMESTEKLLSEKGFVEVKLRSELASNQYILASNQSRGGTGLASSRGSTATATTSSAVDWSLPPRCRFVQLPNVFDVYSWGSVLPGVEAVNNNESSSKLALPPGHFLIERPRHKLHEELPSGFQLGIKEQFRNMRVSNLPPQLEIMHLVPVRYLPRGVNIINTSALSKNSFNNMSGATFMGLYNNTYVKKNFEPRWIPRISPFEPVSSKAVALPWPESIGRNESTMDLFREAFMMLLVRDHIKSEQGSRAQRGRPETAYPSNIIRHRDSDQLSQELMKIVGDPQRDAFLLNAPADFSQQALDKRIPAARIEIVKIGDGFPSPLDRFKNPAKGAGSSSTGLRTLTAAGDDAVVYPRVSRLHRQQFLDPSIEMNKFLAQLNVFCFGRDPEEVRLELAHLQFNVLDHGLIHALESIELLKDHAQDLSDSLKQSKSDNTRLGEQLNVVSTQMKGLQIQVQTDDDLRAIIERLKKMIADRDEENKKLKTMTTDVQDRLQRQVDVLTTEVSRLETQDDSVKEEGGSTGQVSSVNGTPSQPQPNISHESIAKFQQHVEADVRRLTSSITGVFMRLASELTRSANESDSRVVSRGDKVSSSLRMLDIVEEYERSTSVSASNSVVDDSTEVTGIGVSQKSDIRLASSLEDEDGLSQQAENGAGSVMSLGHNTMGSLQSWGSVDASIGHRARDLTKDSHGRAISVSDSFPLDVKNLYKIRAPDPDSNDFMTLSKPLKPPSSRSQRQRELNVSQSLPTLSLTNQAAKSRDIHSAVSIPLKLPPKISTSNTIEQMNDSEREVDFAEEDRTHATLSSLRSLFAAVNQSVMHNSTVITSSTENQVNGAARWLQHESTLQEIGDHLLRLAHQLFVRQDAKFRRTLLFYETENRMLLKKVSDLQSKQEPLRPQTQPSLVTYPDSANDSVSEAVHAIAGAMAFDDDSQPPSLRSSYLQPLLPAHIQQHQRQSETLMMSAQIEALREKVQRYEAQLIAPVLHPLEAMVDQLRTLQALHQELRFTTLTLKQLSVAEERRLHKASPFALQALRSNSTQSPPHSPTKGPRQLSGKMLLKSVGSSLRNLNATIKHMKEGNAEDSQAVENANDVKAIQYRILRLRIQSKSCSERAHVVKQEIDQLVARIFEHVELYQRSVSDLLPPRMFHSLLSKSAQHYDRLRHSSVNVPTEDSVISLVTADSKDSAKSVPVLPKPLPSIGSQPPSTAKRSIGSIGSMPPASSVSHLLSRSRVDSGPALLSSSLKQGGGSVNSYSSKGFHSSLSSIQ